MAKSAAWSGSLPASQGGRGDLPGCAGGARRQPAEEEVRLPQPLSGARGGGARWYRIRARPVSLRGGARAGRRLDRRGRQRRAGEAGERVPGTPARDRLSRPCAGRLLLRRAAGPSSTSTRRLRTGSASTSPNSAGRAEAGRHRRGRGRGAAAALSPVPGEVETEMIDLDLRQAQRPSLPVRLLHRVPSRRTARRGRRAPSSSTAPRRGRRRRCAPPKCASRASSTTRRSRSPPSTGTARSAAPTRRSAACSRRVRRRRTALDLVDVVVEADREAIERRDRAWPREGQGEIAPVDAALSARASGARASTSRRSRTSDRDGEAVIVYALDITEQRGAREAVRAAPEDAGGRAARRRHRARFQQRADRDHRLLRPAAREPPAERPVLPGHHDIKQNANRAAALVRQLLAFSRRQTLRPQVLQLGE